MYLKFFVCYYFIKIMYKKIYLNIYVCSLFHLSHIPWYYIRSYVSEIQLGAWSARQLWHNKNDIKGKGVDVRSGVWLFPILVCLVCQPDGYNLFCVIRSDTNYFTSMWRPVPVAFYWYQIYWYSPKFDYSVGNNARSGQFLRAWRKAS